MPDTLLILSSESSQDSDRALESFADFLGVRTRLISLSGQTAHPDAEIKPEHCLALSSATAKSLWDHSWFQDLRRDSGCVFIYGFSQAAAELGVISGNALTSVVTVESGHKDYAMHVCPALPVFPVTGKTCAVVSATAVNAFSVPVTTGQVNTIISVNQQPCFISLDHGGARLFLLADQSLLDINKPVRPGFVMREYYAQWCALGMLLRSVFGADCWTAPNQAAVVTIDDPSLQKRYGFVDYEKLVPQMEKAGCALTIGFIPYNHGRSDPKVVNILRRHSNRFSITVHGCDHTGGEFASNDERWLNGIANCALERMESHYRRTQMPYDDAMIFPQGRFSIQAMKVLKECDYVAAVNSSPWARDVGDGIMSPRNLLDVAVTSYGSFPLFTRRYPRDIFDFAFDALFQKPLIVVEHHEYFKDGYEAFNGFIGQMNALEATKLTWMPLGRAVTSSCIMRRLGDGHQQVRFFTPVFNLRNPAGARATFSLVKPETSERVMDVQWRGKSIPFEIHSGNLHCEVQADAGEEQQLKIVYRKVQKTSHRPSVKYRCRVFVRRWLSDVRDNYMARNLFLLSTVKKTKRLLDRNV
jgi:hypothetical protein